MTRENLARGLSRQEVSTLREEAWLGDAVLELYVRERILEEDAARNDARRISLVRNSFLNRLGQPTRVEAEIGRRYRQGGLDAAFAWIGEEMSGMMQQQAMLPVKNQRTSRPSRKRH